MKTNNKRQRLQSTADRNAKYHMRLTYFTAFFNEIIVKKLDSLKRFVRTTVAASHN